jgi:hypothetical protein
VFRPQRLGVLIDKATQGALGQAGRRGGRDLLHGGEVEGAGGIGADASDDDFAPLGGECTDLGQLLRSRFAFRHEQLLPQVMTIFADAFLFSLYHPVLAPAKRVLASSWKAALDSRFIAPATPI